MTKQHDTTTAGNQARFEAGLEVMQTVRGDAAAKWVESMQEIAPDLAHHVAAYGFGDIYARPGLEPQQRQLVTIGALMAMGGCEHQLQMHIEGALNVGVTTTEIVEAIIHASVYCGYPRALNAMEVARQVFRDRDLLPAP